jgi:hypothetical protein
MTGSREMEDSAKNMHAAATPLVPPGDPEVKGPYSIAMMLTMSIFDHF